MWQISGCVFLLLAACAEKEKSEEPKAKPKAEAETIRLVARVQSRPGGKDFVLLESYGKWTLAEGALLYAYGNDGRTASLELTGEKLGQFVAADIKSGQVEIGDAVYHRAKPPEAKVDATPAEAPAEAPAAPAIPAVEEKPAGSNRIEPVPLPSY